MIAKGSVRGWSVNALLLLASLALGLAALELVFRLQRSRSGGGKEQAEEARYTAYDPLLGWSKIPGARVTYQRREYQVEVVVNDKGLRDPPRSYRPAAGVRRILAVGDSFLEGYTVPLEDTVTQRLQARLLDESCSAEVINGGTAAYSTDQELLFFRSEGVRYQPRVVTVFFYYNDVFYNDVQGYFGRPKPVFQRAGSGIELHRYPVRRPRELPVIPEPEAVAPASGSALVEWVSERLWMGAPGLYDALSVLRLWEPMPRVAPRQELRVFGVRQDPRLEEAWDKTEAILRTFRDEVEQSGAHFLVVYVPSRMEVQDDSWEVTRALYRSVTFERGAVARRLAALGERDGFEVLDLTDPLRAADRGLLGRPYLQFDGHWTARGHAAAAEALHGFLARAGWLASCASDPGLNGDSG